MHFSLYWINIFENMEMKDLTKMLRALLKKAND